MTTSIFIFHNDLRLQDNTGLEFALKNYDIVIPVFIAESAQLDKNKLKSDNAVQFMYESLSELDEKLKKKDSKIHLLYNADSLLELCKKVNPEAVISNANYTPFAIKRDLDYADICKKHNCKFLLFEDFGLLPIGAQKDNPNPFIASLDKEIPENSRCEYLLNFIATSETKVYQKYTPYYNNIKSINIRNPTRNNKSNYGKINSVGKLKIFGPDKLKEYFQPNSVCSELFPGGRSEGLKRVNKIPNDYGQTRNDLDNETSQLSAYIKFGCVSIREVYWPAKGNTDFIKQLYWRDFYMNIIWQYPNVLSNNWDNANFKEKYSKVKWETQKSASKDEKNKFKDWCNGETGYPIVDAAMRQLNQTGYMHNRGRLITSGFLVKLMGWHWREGELYFAKKLVDYDPASNNGNWQFISGSGVDSQPYYRILNPLRQSEKFDPEGVYILKYLPELESLIKSKVGHIHNWPDHYKDYPNEEHPDVEYYKPIIDYTYSRDKIKKMYKKIF